MLHLLRSLWGLSVRSRDLHSDHANVRLWCSGSMCYVFIDVHEQREKVVGWWLFCGGGVSDTVSGRSIGCQIGRTSPWSCFRGWGVAPSCFGRNAKRGASSPGYCGWCADTFQPELVACSRAAQIVDESLGDFHGGWVQKKKRHHGTDVFLAIYVGFIIQKWNNMCRVRHHCTDLFSAIYVWFSTPKWNHMCHAGHHGTEPFLMVSVESFQKKMRQCVPFTALWYWTFCFFLCANGCKHISSEVLSHVWFTVSRYWSFWAIFVVVSIQTWNNMFHS